MTHLLILLFYLFHYGRAQVLVGTIPLVVRSPYLNCWSYSSQDEASITPSMVAANCDRSNWVLTEDASVCYYQAWKNTKIDCTLVP